MSQSSQPPDLPKDTAAIVPPIPVPTHGPGGVFAVACSTTIQAPARTCLEKVLDMESYSLWNTFVTKASVASPGSLNSEDEDVASLINPQNVAPGAKLKFDAVMSVGSSPYKVDPEVTFLETFTPSSSSSTTTDGGRKGKGYRVCWKSTGMPHFLLHTERVQEFVEVAGAETEYSCWETFGGWLAHLVPKGQVADGFERWMTSLKKVVEEEARAGSS
ncbi:hypothetical protein F5Y16DRAFT_125625 [Xylariaceae sp. FL0255]|nr:hypothetical protein F5Y16DRAFT_125625 [Xylariaceae sp. FL0255]